MNRIAAAEQMSVLPPNLYCDSTIAHKLWPHTSKDKTHVKNTCPRLQFSILGWSINVLEATPIPNRLVPIFSHSYQVILVPYDTAKAVFPACFYCVKQVDKTHTFFNKHCRIVRCFHAYCAYDFHTSAAYMCQYSATSNEKDVYTSQ